MKVFLSLWMWGGGKGRQQMVHSLFDYLFGEVCIFFLEVLSDELEKKKALSLQYVLLSEVGFLWQPQL